MSTMAMAMIRVVQPDFKGKFVIHSSVPMSNPDTDDTVLVMGTFDTAGEAVVFIVANMPHYADILTVCPLFDPPENQRKIDPKVSESFELGRVATIGGGGLSDERREFFTNKAKEIIEAGKAAGKPLKEVADEVKALMVQAKDEILKSAVLQEDDERLAIIQSGVHQATKGGKDKLN